MPIPTPKTAAEARNLRKVAVQVNIAADHFERYGDNPYIVRDLRDLYHSLWDAGSINGWGPIGDAAY